VSVLGTQMGDLEVTTEWSAATITLHAAGPVDGKTAASLHEPLLEAAAAPNATVCLDLARVPYMSNAGLRVLVPPHIKHLLSSAGFTSFVDVA
jgi:anti-anti-sigma factor